MSKKLRESKPTSFRGIKQNSIAAFGLQPKSKTDDRLEVKPLKFQWVSKPDGRYKSRIYSYRDDIPRNDYENIIKAEFVDEFMTAAKRDGLSVTDRDLELIRFKENDPRIEGGKLTPNVVPTNIERVRQHAQKFRDASGTLNPRLVKRSGALTVNTIKSQIAQDAAEGKLPYYEILLDHLISNKGQAFKPVVLIDDLEKFKSAGFVKNRAPAVTELLNDFGEIAGPVGLICASINGNAVRLLPQFFKSGGKTPTVDDLMKEATIHFHGSQGHMLVDSYIEYRGKVVRVSSKNAGEQLSGGQGASVDGIFKSLDEIAANPEAKTRFEQLISDGRYDAVFKQLRLVAKAFDPSELNEGLRGYIAQFKLLAELNDENPDITITDGDIAILKEIWQAANSTDIGMNDFKYLLGAAFGNQPDIDQRQSENPGYIAQVFTPKFAQLLRSFNLNRFGEPGISGVEKVRLDDDKNQKRGWWRRLKKALVFRVSKRINSDPKFSEFCTWILNHGAFCQIDTRYRLGDDKSSVIVTNISATWPSTAVDSVRLMPLPSGDGFRYKLDINNGSGFDAAAYNRVVSGGGNDLDYDFGFKTKEEREQGRVAMIPKALDLARNAKDWLELQVTTAQSTGRGNMKTGAQEIPGVAARRQITRGTRSSRILINFFNDLNKLGLNRPVEVPKVDDERDVDLVTAYVAPTLELAQGILEGDLPDGLRKAIRYSINALWGMPSQLGEAEEDEEEDDDDSDDAPKIKPERARDIANRHATIAKTLMNLLYSCVRIYDARASDMKPTDAEYLRREHDLLRWVAAVDRDSVPVFKQILAQGPSNVKRVRANVAGPARVERPAPARRGRPAAVRADTDPLPDNPVNLRAAIISLGKQPNTPIGKWIASKPEGQREDYIKALLRAARTGNFATWGDLYHRLQRITLDESSIFSTLVNIVA
jgi:hypothetical protein